MGRGTKRCRGPSLHDDVEEEQEDDADDLLMLAPPAKHPRILPALTLKEPPGAAALEALFLSHIDPLDGSLDYCSAYGYFLSASPVLDLAMAHCGLRYRSGVFHSSPSAIKVVGFIAVLDFLEECPLTPRIVSGHSTLSLVRRSREIARAVLRDRVGFLQGRAEPGMEALSGCPAVRKEARMQTPAVRISVDRLRDGIRARVRVLNPQWFAYLPDIVLLEGHGGAPPKEPSSFMSGIAGSISKSCVNWLIGKLETPRYLTAMWILAGLLTADAWDIISLKEVLEATGVLP